MLRRTFLAITIFASLFTNSIIHAQVPNAVAFCYLDQTQFGGAISGNPTGWDWYLFCAYSATNGSKVPVPTIKISTLDNDTLAQIGQKLANGVKAEGTRRGMNTTLVLLPSTSFVTPQ